MSLVSLSGTPVSDIEYGLLPSARLPVIYIGYGLVLPSSGLHDQDLGDSGKNLEHLWLYWIWAVPLASTTHPDSCMMALLDMVLYQIWVVTIIIARYNAASD